MKKIDKQFNELKKRGINVSYSRFEEYYNVTRQAKAKLNRLNLTKDTNNLIRNRTISNNVNFIRTQADFDKAFKARKKVVQKDFIFKDNQAAKKEIKKNIHKAFGYSKRVNKLISSIESMPVKDLKKFMNENKDLYAILWYADQDLIDKLGLQISDFEQRLKDFDSQFVDKLKAKLDVGRDGEFELRFKRAKKPKKRKSKRSNIYEEGLEAIRKLNPELFKK